MPNYQANTTSLPALIPVDAGLIAQQFKSADLERLGIAAEDLERWKRHYAPDAPVDDYLKFIEKCLVYGVDPRRNRAFIVGRWDKSKGRVVYTFQMSLAGLLSLAQDTNQFEGFTRAEFCNERGQWRDIWLKKDPETGNDAGNPYACRVGIYRTGFRVPLEVTVYFDEIAPRDNKGEITNPFWKSKPILMLEKCTKAKSIREAFEEKAGNVYIPEEMHQANADKDYVATIPRYDMVDPASEDAKTPTGYGEPAQAKPEPEHNVVESSVEPAPPAQAPQRKQEESLPSERELKAQIEGLELTINRAPATLQQVLEIFFNRDVSHMLESEWTYAESRHVHLKIEEIKAKREAKKKAA